MKFLLLLAALAAPSAGSATGPAPLDRLAGTYQAAGTWETWGSRGLRPTEECPPFFEEWFFSPGKIVCASIRGSHRFRLELTVRRTASRGPTLLVTVDGRYRPAGLGTSDPRGEPFAGSLLVTPRAGGRLDLRFVDDFKEYRPAETLTLVRAGKPGR